MSAKTHVWRRLSLKPMGRFGDWVSECERVLPNSVEPADHEDATCLRCLRYIQEDALWKSENSARIARETTQRIESLSRKKNKRRARKDGE